MMHTIYVFGSTGNSLWLARETARVLAGAETGNPEGNAVVIKSIPALMKTGTWRIEGDTAGFAVPCYYGTVPLIVKEFIARAEKVESPYLWAIVSGGGTIGTSFGDIDQAFRDRGTKLSLGRPVILASNYMNGWYYELISPDSRTLERRLTAAETACAETAANIRARTVQLPQERKSSNFIPHLLTPSRYVRDTHPWANEFSAGDRCTGCGTCARMCPVGNIAMKPINDRSGSASLHPVFGASCERCMACMQFCPAGALNILGKSMNKKRYLNPRITATDLEAFNRV